MTAKTKKLDANSPGVVRQRRWQSTKLDYSQPVDSDLVHRPRRVYGPVHIVKPDAPYWSPVAICEAWVGSVRRTDYGRLGEIPEGVRADLCPKCARIYRNTMKEG